MRNLAAAAERRREIRSPADGAVRLWPESLEFTAIQGRLLDVASSGFRARHGCQALGPGQFARFEYEGACGRACVVWNRISDGEVETGFRVVRQDSPPAQR